MMYEYDLYSVARYVNIKVNKIRIWFYLLDVRFNTVWLKQNIRK